MKESTPRGVLFYIHDTERAARDPQTGISVYVEDMSYEEWKEKYVDNIDKDVANSGESGIIKNITIDDFEDAAYGKNIDKEVLNTIYSVVRNGEDTGKMFISEVYVGSFGKNVNGGGILMQIDPMPAGKSSMCRLNINSDIVSGRTIDEINAQIKNTQSIVSQNLEEATIHETGHAKAYYQKSLKEIEDMNKAIANANIEGVSKIAKEDGAECIAETEVLLYRGTNVPDEAMKLYDKYVGR